MIRQTMAIFHDGYRELNSRRMFWTVMILSGLAMGVFSIVGVRGQEMRILKWPIPEFSTGIIDPTVIYRELFSSLMVGVWLTWLSPILALISTAGIFPDFLSGGSIDLYLSRPISRVRLFLTKYVSGLLFVVLQNGLFAVCSFLVMGWRGSVWNPYVFWLIPIVVCFYSYLYCMSVFFGVVTRSTLAAILLTLLFWGMLVLVDRAETTLVMWRNVQEDRLAEPVAQIARFDDMIARLSKRNDGGSETAKGVIDDYVRQRKQAVETRDELQSSIRRWNVIRRFAMGIKTIVPKTKATTDLLDRALFSDEEFARKMRMSDHNNHRGRHGEEEAQWIRAGIQAQIDMRNRSVGWIVGTSLMFEAVAIALTAWIFCRRDF